MSSESVNFKSEIEEINYEDCNFLIHHVFFPRKLPEKSEKKHNLAEGYFPVLISETLDNFKNNEASIFYSEALKISNFWRDVQYNILADVSKVFEVLTIAIKRKGLFPFYLKNQNCTIILSFLPEMAPGAILVFQPCLENEKIMSNMGDFIGSYPSSSVSLNSLNIVSSESFAEQLVYLCNTSLDESAAHSKKKNTSQKEERNVENPKLVLEWLTSVLCGECSINHQIKPILKKVRDEILWDNCLLPFRRSGMWMSVKVVMHLCFNYFHGEIDGTILYKLMLLQIMISMIDMFCYKIVMDNDLILQMIGKVSRRMIKLENKIKETSNNMLIDLVNKMLSSFLPIIDSTKTKLNNLDHTKYRAQPAVLDKFNIYPKHCKLDLRNVSNEIDNIIALSHPDYLAKPHHPDYDCFKRIDKEQKEPSFSFLKSDDLNALSFAIPDVENWLKKNIYTLTLQHSASWIFELFETYLAACEKYYVNDQLGVSRMIAASLHIICALDQIATNEFPLLLKHSTGIDVKLFFEKLLIEKSSDIEYVTKYKKYILDRQKNASYPSLLEDGPIKKRFFSVRYAKLNKEMQKLKEKILNQAEYNKEKKMKELGKTREIYLRLMKLYIESECTYITLKSHYPPYETYTKHDRKCQRCNYKNQADGLYVTIYEWPLPNDSNLKNAIIFELLIPKSIAILRDATHLFYIKVLKFKENYIYSSSIENLWINYSEINKYSLNNQKYITLGSTSKLFTQSHYNRKSPCDDDSEFICPNGYNIQLSHKIDKNTISYEKIFENDRLSFKFDKASPYYSLEFTLNGTLHNENEVLAKQYLCNKTLDVREFIKFGILRAGHRLQLRNIMEALESRSLSFGAVESYLIIFISLYQMGPSIEELNDSESIKQYESHSDLNNQDFTLKMSQILTELLSNYQENWKDHYILFILTIITTRCISFEKDEKVKEILIKLLLNIRKTSVLWELKVEQVVNDLKECSKSKMIEMKNKLIEISCCTILTYQVDQNDLKLVLNCDQDLIVWLESMSKIYKNTSNYNNVSTDFLRNLLRQVNCVSIAIESQFVLVLDSNDKSALSQYLERNWSDYKLGILGSWDLNYNGCERWYKTEFIHNKKLKKTIEISFNGSFLINGNPIGKLPKEISSNSDYIRVFGEIVFDVQEATESKDSYVTVRKAYNNAESYTFKLKDGKLLIKERQINGKCFFYFQNKHFLKELEELPYKLVNHYSHWLNIEENYIDFRPVSYELENFKEVFYRIDLNEKKLKEISSDRIMLRVSSKTFTQIYENFFKMLEIQKHVQMFYSEKENEFTVDIPRMGLSFKIDNESLYSKEFNNMKISENQQLDTLLGIEQGLVLEETNEALPLDSKKYFLVPHGVLKFESNSQVNIEFDDNNLKDPPYFLYEIDPKLQQLKAGESKTAWIYLVWMHALTSKILPDKFLGMTGTEMALKLLQSSNCWSCEPYNQESLFILEQISKITPQRKFYPPQLKVMQKISWNDMNSFSAHPAFYLIVNELIKESNALEFAFPSNKKDITINVGKNSDQKIKNQKEEEDKTENNSFLVLKAYHRYKKLYPFFGKMSEDFERKFDTPKNVLVFDKKYDWYDDKIGRIRLLSQIYNNKLSVSGCETDFSFLLKESTLKGYTDERVGNVFSDWIIFKDISEFWFNLYHWCVNVKSDEEKNKIVLFLSSLIYIHDMPMKYLNLFILIILNQKEFKCIDFPMFADYINPKENSYNKNKILEIFDSGFIKENNYQTHYNSKYFSFSDEKLRILNEYREKTDNLKKIWEEQVFTAWKNRKFNDLNFTNHMLERDISLNIQAILEKWYKNEQLNCFFTELRKLIDNFNYHDTITSVNMYTIQKLYEYPIYDNFDESDKEITINFKACDEKNKEILEEAKTIYKSGRFSFYIEDKKIAVNENYNKIIVSEKKVDNKEEENMKDFPSDQNDNKTSYNDKKNKEDNPLPIMISPSDSTKLQEASIQGLVSEIKFGINDENNIQYDKKKLDINEEEDKIPDFPLEIDSSNCQLMKNQLESLKESWNDHYKNKFKEKKIIKQAIDLNEINLELILIINKTNEFYNTLLSLLSPKTSAELAFYKAELWPRLTPHLFISFLINTQKSSLTLNSDIVDLIGAIIVLWTLQQRLIRIIQYSSYGDTMKVPLNREFENKGHENWSPKEYPEWLLLELGFDMMIRPIQIEIAKEMMNPKSHKNTVMQLNMGEGKTSVIIPLLCAALADGEKLVQITVLKSLFKMNYSALMSKIGLILDRRVYVFPFRRDLDFKQEHISSFFSVLKDCKNRKGVILTLPEYRLSFKLKGLELSFGKDESLAQLFLEIQNYIDLNVRNIIDESDEILSVKYQLIYTISNQTEVDGGSLRWKVPQTLLRIARRHYNHIKQKYGESCIQYNEIDGLAYPCIRLLNKKGYKELCELICFDLFTGNAEELQIKAFKNEHINWLLDYIFENEIKNQHEIDALVDKDEGLIDILYILRGLFTTEIFYLALSKRWRVNYGINDNIDRMLYQAVPYRAKDVPAERAQFAHPDVAIILTILSYYNSGILDCHMEQVFEHLDKAQDKDSIYESWINDFPNNNEAPSNMKEFGGLNLADLNMKYNVLFPKLRKHPKVIDFWLNLIVFPKEAKQFMNKLGTSAWDLCNTEDNFMTGFSGTNDSSILLPLNTVFSGLAELNDTNGSLIANILMKENNEYKDLKSGITAHEIVQLISESIPIKKVLLDVGALMLDMHNEEVAKEWLKLVKNVEAAIYFDEYNNLMVLDRLNRKSSFQLSPYKTQLSKCVIYLDDSHTRGTDLKIPSNTQAIVTLGKGLTKDRILQACMRMRLFGKGHYVSFWAAYDVHNTIKEFSKDVKTIGSKEVLEWAIRNTRDANKDGFIYWASQGLSYYKKKAAFKQFQNNLNLEKLGLGSYEYEQTELSKIYGSDRKEELVSSIVTIKQNYHKEILKKADISPDFFMQNAEGIYNYVVKYVEKEKCFSHCLDEEQEMELEMEIEEEREYEFPQQKTPCEPTLNPDFQKAIETEDYNSLFQNNSLFPFTDVFKKTSIKQISQPDAWSPFVFVTQDFLNVIVESYKFIKDTPSDEDEYLRNPRWMIIIKIQGKQVIIIVSGYEANAYYFNFIAAMNMNFLLFSPRLRKQQIRIISFPDISFKINDIEQIAIFAGSLYLASWDEQKKFLKFLGYYPTLRNQIEEALFQEGIINRDGFITVDKRNRLAEYIKNYKASKFQDDPGSLIVKLYEIRNYSIIPINAHHLDIIKKGKKPIDKLN